MPQSAYINNSDNSPRLFPLSSIQQAYFFGQQDSFDLHVATHTYFEFVLPHLDNDHLQRCFNQLIQHYDALRAVITHDGELQILSTVAPYKITINDLRQLNQASAETELSTTRGQFKRSNFDFSCWPNFDIKISRLDSQDHVHINVSPMFIDGFSVSRLLHNLSRLYQDPQATLSETSFDYGQYALHRESLKDSKSYLKANQYWTNRFTEFPSGPELPLAHGRHQPQRSELNRRRKIIDAKHWQQIKQSAQQHGLKNTALMLTLYGATIAQWSKNKHFILTMLVQRRDKQFPGCDTAVASFSSTIFVELDFRKNRSLIEHVKIVQKQLFLDLMNSQVCGLALMQQRNRETHSIARVASPVAFVSNIDSNITTTGSNDYFHRNGNYLVDSNLETPQVYLDHQIAETDRNELAINWDAIDNVLYPGVADAMLTAYVAMIHKIAKPQFDWHEHLVIPASKQEQELILGTNQTQINYPISCLQDLFFAQVNKQASKAAIIDAEHTISYQQLATHSSTIRHYIINNRYNELQNDHNVVAIFMHKGWQQVAAALGITAAGASYLPIDPELPATRIEYLLNCCDVDIVLTQAVYQTRAEIQSRVCIVVTQNMQNDNEPYAIPARNEIDVCKLAYLIFTSGSTGLPKGVMLDHRGPVNTILDINNRFNIGEQDRIFGISALSFDLSVYDLFGSLAAGGTLVLPDSKHLRDPDHWLDVLENQQITVWNSAPALMQMLIEYVQHGKRSLPQSLRVIMMSGDWIPTWLPSAIQQQLPNASIISLGGATEASIWSIYYAINNVEAAWLSIPYGKALGNQSMYVLDTNLQARSIGATGEIYIGGIGLALGYWKNQDITQAAFITHPNTGQRLYRTGDLGRYLLDGNIEFLGREDAQIKLQGYRVELGEIETVLQQHAMVSQAVLIVHGDNAANQQLLAYVAINLNDLSADDIRHYAQAHLPHYMVPKHFVLLEQMPVTSNGKVDRKNLPEFTLGQARSNTDNQFQPPGTETEKTLALIWQEILAIELDSIGCNMSFFDLGGQSFLSVRLMSKIEQQFNLELPLATLIEADTIAALAEKIESAREGSTNLSPLVLMQRHTPQQQQQSLTPLFLVHPVGGNVLCYRDLVLKMRTQNRDIYGLQSTHTSENMTLTAMAEQFISAIKEQYSGPYCIGGWSMGGVIAAEMARQLYANGDQVEHLFMFDSPAPLDHNLPTDSMIIEWFLHDLLPDNMSWWQPYQAKHANNIGHHQVLQYIVEQRLVAPGMTVKQLDSIYQIFITNLKALRQHHSETIAGVKKMLILRASDTVIKELQSHPAVNDDSWGWDQLLTITPEVDTVNGNHYSIFDSTNLDSLFQKLSHWLQKT